MTPIVSNSMEQNNLADAAVICLLWNRKSSKNSLLTITSII